ncbi:MAG: class D beta-lactamase [Verrucomicrobiaceae bacterium]|nr:class D beta-lactamase [Verrucomicrobiaceae bacterium]
MKPTYILYLCVWLWSHAFAAETSVERDLTAEFGSYSGAFALYDEAQQRWLRYQPEQCRIRTSPCSTFKVLNSLIALRPAWPAALISPALGWHSPLHRILESKPDFAGAFSLVLRLVLSGFGDAHQLGAIPSDHSKVGCGNNDLKGGVTQFWLQSSLTISPDEQVDFLRRLHARKLPFAAKSVDTVLDIMTLSQAGQTVFRGKTGSAFDAKKERPETWLVHR